jgi:hypothetical protein
MNGQPVTIRTILPDILGAKGLVGVPPEIAEDAIRKTAIDFCTQTTIWEYENGFKTQYNVADYPIYTPEGSRLASMKWVAVDGVQLNSSITAGRPMFLGTRSLNPNSFIGQGRGFTFTMDGRNVLWISPPPMDSQCCQYVTYCAALKPTQDACEIPEILYEDWNDALCSGAAFRLFSIPRQEWSSPGLAMQNAREYSRWLARARLTRMQNYSQAGVQMSGSYF